MRRLLSPDPGLPHHYLHTLRVQTEDTDNMKPIVETIKVTVVTYSEGLGSEDDPVRRVYSYYDESGNLLFTRDPCPGGIENHYLLARLDEWQPGIDEAGPLIRWAAAHLLGCVG